MSTEFHISSKLFDYKTKIILILQALVGMNYFINNGLYDSKLIFLIHNGVTVDCMVVQYR